MIYASYNNYDCYDDGDDVMISATMMTSIIVCYCAHYFANWGAAGAVKCMRANAKSGLAL